MTHRPKAPPRTIEHITITSGAVRMSPRSEVDQSVVEALQADLRRGDGILLGSPWRIAFGRRDHQAVQFDLSWQGLVIVRCWLALAESATEALWEEAQAAALDERVVLARPRGAPWLAVALTTDALSAPADVLMAAGDAERCVAWALIP